MKIEEALVRLRSYPEFRVVMEAAEEKRPFLRAMNPTDALDHQAQRLLWDSAMQRGFDLLMNYMRGTDEWQSRNK